MESNFPTQTLTMWEISEGGQDEKEALPWPLVIPWFGVRESKGQNEHEEEVLFSLEDLLIHGPHLHM